MKPLVLPLPIPQAVADGDPIRATGLDGFVFVLSGTFVADIELWGSVDGDTWVDIGSGDYNAPGIDTFRFYGALKWIRSKVTDYTSGEPIGVIAGGDTRSV